MDEWKWKRQFKVKGEILCLRHRKHSIWSNYTQRLLSEQTCSELYNAIKSAY